MFFDCVVQHHNCDLGVAGKTDVADAPVPAADAAADRAAVAAERRVDGGRIRSTIRLLDGDRLLCEAEVEAVAGDRPPCPRSPPAGAGRESPPTPRPSPRSWPCVDGTARRPPAIVTDRRRHHLRRARRRQRRRRGPARRRRGGRGDRVALLAPNGIEWAITAYAVLRIGAVLVPLSTLLRPPELLAQLTTASVSHLVTVPTFRDRRYLDDLDDAAPGLLDAVAVGARHSSAPTCGGSGRSTASRRPVAAPDASEPWRRGPAGGRPRRAVHLRQPGRRRA